MSLRIVPGLREFLRQYPGVSLTPVYDDKITLKGRFDFAAKLEDDVVINDFYCLRIDIPQRFPKDLPVVTETDRKIPRNNKYHVNDDGSLCLGAPLHLRWKLANKPSLVGFATDCLMPYLYAISYKMKYGKFPFGELLHGGPGLIQDYLSLFGLKNKDQVVETFRLLGMKRRIANKRNCPCGCGFRLGKCQFRKKINKYRYWTSRSWFRGHSKDL